MSGGKHICEQNQIRLSKPFYFETHINIHYTELLVSVLRLFSVKIFGTELLGCEFKLADYIHFHTVIC